MASHNSKTTTDHGEIRKWAEARDATPACVKGTGGRNDPGMIRLDFPGYSGKDSLQEISWDEWFDAFDENQLALVYQDRTASGKRSNFNKLVGRETARARRDGDSHASRRHGTSSAAGSGTSRAKTSGGTARSSSDGRTRRTSGSTTRTRRTSASSGGTRASRTSRSTAHAKKK